MNYDKNQYLDMYQKHYERYGRISVGIIEHEEKYRLWKKAGYKKSMNVLDYGCGIGLMAECIPSKHYKGVDIVEKAIEMAKVEHPQHDFQVSEMGCLNLPKKFDFVAAMSVFTHIPFAYQKECLDEIKRVMKPGAIGVIDILPGETNHADQHAIWWIPDEFEKLLNEVGFSFTHLETIKWPTGFTHMYYSVCII